MDPKSPDRHSIKNGLYFEEFLTDRNYVTNSRTITETDHINFISSFGFFEPLFMDQAYVAAETPYDGRIVPGALTFSVSEGLTILSGILHGTGMAFLEVKLKVLKPVFIDDTITVEIAVLTKRETKKTDRGIVTFFQRVINQDNTSVMEYNIKRMIRRKPG